MVVGDIAQFTGIIDEVVEAVRRLAAEGLYPMEFPAPVLGGGNHRRGIVGVDLGIAGEAGRREPSALFGQGAEVLAQQTGRAVDAEDGEDGRHDVAVVARPGDDLSRSWTRDARRQEDEKRQADDLFMKVTGETGRGVADVAAFEDFVAMVGGDDDHRVVE